jgi:hypothetical protein
MNERPDAEVLRSLFSYEPNTGILRWKTRPSTRSTARAGDEAGTVNRQGKYKSRRVTVKGRVYAVHNVIWCIVTGEWQVIEIDHEDCDGTNNRWSNLRPATRLQQSHNRPLQTNNKSGFKGVRWRRQERKWVARITVEGKKVGLGFFDHPEEAAHAYNKAAVKYFGEFATLNPVGGNFAD